MSILEGIEDIPKHIEAWVKGEEALHPDVKTAIGFLQNSIAALLKETLPTLEAAKTSMLGEVATALTGGDKTAAGKAIIATAKTVVTTIGDDALHILATDVLAI
jgi:hypothetical protein